MGLNFTAMVVEAVENAEAVDREPGREGAGI